MKKIRNSFSAKVRLYALSVGLISLTLAGIIFIYYDSNDARETISKNLELKANVISKYAIDAIIDTNPIKGHQIFDAFSIEQDILGAWIYLANNRLLTGYDPRSTGFVALPAKYMTSGIYYEGNTVLVSKPIIYQNQKIGSVLIRESLENLEYRMLFHISVVMGIMVVSLMIAFLISIKFHRYLTRPLFELISMFATISDTN